MLGMPQRAAATEMDDKPLQHGAAVRVCKQCNPRRNPRAAPGGQHDAMRPPRPALLLLACAPLWALAEPTPAQRATAARQTAEASAACLDSPLNGRGRIDPATENRFAYNGGHLQKHAVLMGLGSLGPDGLAQAVQQALAPALGADWRLSYSQAMPAGGGVTSAADYARFLRALLDGRLQLGALLGTQAVCTQPQACPGDAVKTPIPRAERWHYSLAHWVEDDPQVGDGAFSSPGAFGFYPWISADRRFYGVVAREQRRGALSLDGGEKPAVASVACGREIRAAWLDGQPRR